MIECELLARRRFPAQAGVDGRLRLHRGLVHWIESVMPNMGRCRDVGSGFPWIGSLGSPDAAAAVSLAAFCASFEI